MERTLDEYANRTRKLVEQSDPRADASKLRNVIGAAVDAAKLTGSLEWDRYISWIEHAKDETKALIDTTQSKLNSPMIVNHDDIMRLKLELYGFEWQLQTLDWAQDLPRAIMAQGDQARELDKLFKRTHMDADDTT